VTELTLYGRRLPIPVDAINEMVPIPTTARGVDDWYFHYDGWWLLYSWTVGLASTCEVQEHVMRGAVQS